MKKVKIAIFGASGYTGGELLRLLSNHPSAEIVWAAADTNRGRRVSDVFPGLRGIADMRLAESDVKLMPCGVEIVFTALPHGNSSKIMKRLLKKGVRVIDLGADFRISLENYRQWYGKHPCPELIGEAQYGISELYRDEIADAPIVANPGCHPTAAIMGLAPFMKIISDRQITAVSITGVSGAGRKAEPELVFGEINEAVKPYKVNSHRHIPEIEEKLGTLSGGAVKLSFAPHLAPMDRGILLTSNIRLGRKTDTAELTAMAREFYGKERFVRVHPPGSYPSTSDVRGSNYCDMGVVCSKDGRSATVMSSIDNLMKGASGMAVQNMNIITGCDEDEGLTGAPLFP